MKITPLVERILDQAKEIAFNFEYSTVESSHLLVAMMEIPGSIAATLLFSENVDPEDMMIDIEDFSTQTKVKRNEIALSPRVHQLFLQSEQLAKANEKKRIGTEHLLYAILLDNEGFAVELLKQQSVNTSHLRKMLEQKAGLKAPVKRRTVLPMGKRNQGGAQNSGSSDTPTLDTVSTNLTEAARQGLLDPMIGRDREIDRLIHVLSRRTKNNPVLVGEPGVGKTAIIEGLASRIVEGQVPVDLQESRIMALNMAAVVAGTKFRGEFEDRLTAIVDEVTQTSNVIVFVDELHTIIGAGGGMDSVTDASNILKPALARGDFQLIGATTFNEYQKYIEKDEALERRFARVTVEEPTEDEAVKILHGLKRKFEIYHGVTFEDSALEKAVTLSVRYMSNRRLPDKAIDLLDEAAAAIKISVKNNRKNLIKLEKNQAEKEEEIEQKITDFQIKKAYQLESQLDKINTKISHFAVQSDKLPKVDEQAIYDVVSNLTGVPIQQMTKSEGTRLINLEKELHKRVIGQDEAISAVSRAVRRSRSGIADTGRPMGSFMFLGPTGVGKTELAKALAESVFGDEESMIRIDMSEYMEKFSTSRLIGAPPGYVGYDEGGQLTERVRNKPYSVVLLDEVEKAHPDVFNIMLQILDDGFVTDTKGRKVDFRNTIIIMTSNLGATALRDDKTVGFGAKDSSTDYDSMKSRIMEELKRHYRPEFLNRIDETIVFHPLKKNEIEKVVKIMSRSLVSRLAEQNISIKFTPAAIKKIAEIGFSHEYGARPLRKALQKEVEDLLSEQLINQEIQSGDSISIGVTHKKLEISHIS